MNHPSATALPRALLALLLLLLPASLPRAFAGAGPYNTLLVVNAASRDSRQLGAYYAKAHGLPPANVCMIHVDPHKPSISPGDFETSVRRPILEHMDREGLAPQIHFLVLSMDIPTRVNYFNGLPAALYYGYKPKPPDAPVCNIVPDSVNQYYAAERAYSASADSGSSWNTWLRDVSGLLMKKNGLCVVAPTSVTAPSSTYGSRTSCWDLLKRWISSMKRMVRRPDTASRCFAASSEARNPATFDSTPLERSKARFVACAMTSASDVFPHPGGP